MILDDIVHVSNDQAGISGLFELIGCCYERRWMLFTADQPFAGTRSSQTQPWHPPPFLSDHLTNDLTTINSTGEPASTLIAVFVFVTVKEASYVSVDLKEASWLLVEPDILSGRSAKVVSGDSFPLFG
jgi:hypothetical protein